MQNHTLSKRKNRMTDYFLKIRKPFTIVETLQFKHYSFADWFKWYVSGCTIENMKRFLLQILKNMYMTQCCQFIWRQIELHSIRLENIVFDSNRWRIYFQSNALLVVFIVKTMKMFEKGLLVQISVQFFQKHFARSAKLKYIIARFHYK